MKKLVAWAVLMTVFISTTPAFGQAVIVKPGDVIKQDGIFIPSKDAIEAADMLDRYQLLEQRIIALDAALAAKIDVVLSLEKQLGSSERELALKDLIIQHKDEMLAFRKEMNEEYKSLLKEVRETLTHDKATIERLEKSVESANKRSIWGSILSFVIGVAVAYFSGGILH